MKFTHTAEEGKAQTRRCKPPVTVLYSVQCYDVTEGSGRNVRLRWLLVFLYPCLFSRFVTSVLLASAASPFFFVQFFIYADVLHLVLQFL